MNDMEIEKGIHEYSSIMMWYHSRHKQKKRMVLHIISYFINEKKDKWIEFKTLRERFKRYDAPNPTKDISSNNWAKPFDVNELKRTLDDMVKIGILMVNPTNKHTQYADRKYQIIKLKEMEEVLDAPPEIYWQIVSEIYRDIARDAYIRLKLNPDIVDNDVRLKTVIKFGSNCVIRRDGVKCEDNLEINISNL